MFCVLCFLLCLQTHFEVVSSQVRQVFTSDAPDMGRAEMYIRSCEKWGTICDSAYITEGWPTQFCKDLEYNRAAAAVDASTITVGSGTGPIAAHEPSCTASNKRTMYHCPKDTREGYDFCTHNEDVAVQCMGPKTCGYPFDVGNQPNFIGYLYGDRVEYVCMAGFTHSAGNLLRTCETNGDTWYWTGSPPECKELRCCPPGYDFIEDLPDCYRVDRGQGKKDGSNRTVAESTCAKDGGDLFRWDTCYEFETVRQFLLSTDNAAIEPEKYYVQGDRQAAPSVPYTNTPWYWFDGSVIDLDPLSDCTFWHKKEPNNHKSYKREELCLNMPEHRDYKLNDCWCTKQIGFVCKQAAQKGTACSSPPFTDNDTISCEK